MHGNIRLKIIAFFIHILFVHNSFAQIIIVSQSFEGTFADNWNYTSPTQAGGSGQVVVGAGNYGTGYAKTGNYSLRAAGGSTDCGTGSANCINGAASGGGCNNLPNGKTVEFSTVNVACLENVQITVSHRSHVLCSFQGQGFDSGENLYFQVRLNGGVWTTVGTLGGSNNYTWNYNTNPAGVSSVVSNPFVYNVPAGTLSIGFRTTTNTNRADEVYYIDDVTLRTTTNSYTLPGSTGLWRGQINTDWSNPCNWDDRTLPLSTTDVTIQNTAVNDCEVYSGITANCRNIFIDKRLAVETNTSTLNVTGELRIDLYGTLDMNLSGLDGGTINLSGNWLNYRTESHFDEGKGTVNFIGSSSQYITVVNDSKEAFYKMNINKPGGSIITNDDIWIDKLNVGGISAMLILNNGLLDLNSRTLKIWNPNFQSVVRNGGGIVSEKTDNSSKISWIMNSNNGHYLFPLSKSNGNYIPLTFNKTSGNASEVIISTYGTSSDNLPWPSSPTIVTNLESGIGLMPDNRDATVDRFWQIDVSGTATANLTFTYDASELPITPYDNPNLLQAQRYSPPTNGWEFYLPGQTAGAYSVLVPNVSTFSPWTLTAIASPLPIELLEFKAAVEKKNIKLTWVTASELNNDYFTIQRSKDGVIFETIGIVKGAGNSNSLIKYSFTDYKPYSSISYYRVQQTDFDGSFTFSNIEAVKISQNENLLVNNLYYNNYEGNISIFLNDLTETIILEIIDVKGNIIYSNDYFNEKTIVIPFTQYSKGLYFLRLLSSDIFYTEKIIIY